MGLPAGAMTERLAADLEDGPGRERVGRLAAGDPAEDEKSKHKPDAPAGHGAPPGQKINPVSPGKDRKGNEKSGNAAGTGSAGRGYGDVL